MSRGMPDDPIAPDGIRARARRTLLDCLTVEVGSIEK